MNKADQYINSLIFGTPMSPLKDITVPTPMKRIKIDYIPQEDAVWVKNWKALDKWQMRHYVSLIMNEVSDDS